MTTTNKKIAIIVIVAVITVCISCVIYKVSHKEAETQPDPVIVTNTTTREVREAMPGANDTTVKDVSRQIERTVERDAPRQEWYTTTQERADRDAETYRARDKGDVLLKETAAAKPVDDTTNIIENKYYSVSTARKHDIQLGGAAIDGKGYVTAGYRNRDVTYTAYYDPVHNAGGAGVSVVVAKW